MKFDRRAMRATKSKVAIALVGAVLAGCSQAPPQALGSLEYDRITFPAPAAERIVSIDVREGQHVERGTVIMTLDRKLTDAQLQAAQANRERQRAALSELQIGPRREAIAQARAQLAAAQAQSAQAQASYNRMAALGRGRYVAANDVDAARTAMRTAQAQVQVAQQALDTLLNGNRPEDIAQGRSALAAADATTQAQQVVLDKLNVTAPRAGRIDSLPYKLGDQAPVGAALAVMLADNAPYARIYVPEQVRANVKVGDAMTVHVDGRDRDYRGTVRMIRSDPSFTPYFALTGKDAARLSYLAEVQLGDDAKDLPAGLPLRATFGK